MHLYFLVKYYQVVLTIRCHLEIINFTEFSENIHKKFCRQNFFVFTKCSRVFLYLFSQVKYCQVVLTNHCPLEVIHQRHQPEEIHFDRITTETEIMVTMGKEEAIIILEKHLNPGSLICSNHRNICHRRSHLRNVQKRIRVEVSSKVVSWVF